LKSFPHFIWGKNFKFWMIFIIVFKLLVKVIIFYIHFQSSGFGALSHARFLPDIVLWYQSSKILTHGVVGLANVNLVNWFRLESWLSPFIFFPISLVIPSIVLKKFLKWAIDFFRNVWLKSCSQILPLSKYDPYVAVSQLLSQQTSSKY